MSFLHPEFLWLVPLVAVPILIHLLTRLRYRRVRWAAIDFLLTSERKAVRRARLQQILLMILRTIVLAAALLALLEPIGGGGIGRLLGGRSKIVVLLDSSASMSANSPEGTAYERARRTTLSALRSLPRGTAVAFGAMAGEAQLSSREPLRDLTTVAADLRAAHITDGAANLPQAIAAAADALQRSGGGGIVWLLTDGQASDWRASDSGAWESARRALENAGKPRIVVTQLNMSPGVNFSITHVALTPPVPVEGDAPRLTATIQLHGSAGGVADVSLYFDGKQVDSNSVTFAEPGRADCVFRLPELKSGSHAGYIELAHDAIPADNRFYFTVSTEERVPVLVVDGAPASDPSLSAAHYLELALKPPEAQRGYRSPFLPKVVEPDALAEERLNPYGAVFLADVPSLSEPARSRLAAYVEAGGLLVVFPGAHTVAAEWKATEFPGIALQPLVELPAGKRAKVSWAAAQNPVTATLPAEGMERVLVSRFFPIESAARDTTQVLAGTDAGQPFLVVRQAGKGRVFFFAVSAQFDFSTLPLTPVFLATVHRIVLNHIVEQGTGASHIALAPLMASVQPEWPRILCPDGRVAPLAPLASDPSRASFGGAAVAGIYRLTAVTPDAVVVPGKDDLGPIVAAVNTPPEESEMEVMPSATVSDLLRGSRVVFLPARSGLAAAGQETGGSGWSFPFAVIAAAALVAAVVLAWSIGRPSAATAGRPGAKTNSRPAARTDSPA